MERGNFLQEGMEENNVGMNYTAASSGELNPNEN